MEYKTLKFPDTPQGHREMESTINSLAEEGWTVKSKETVSQGWSFGKTCCLGCAFLPLALLGKKGNEIQVVMERKKK